VPIHRAGELSVATTEREGGPPKNLVRVRLSDAISLIRGVPAFRLVGQLARASYRQMKRHLLRQP
jgi:hypothetical protein